MLAAACVGPRLDVAHPAVTSYLVRRGVDADAVAEAVVRDQALTTRSVGAAATAISLGLKGKRAAVVTDLRRDCLALRAKLDQLQRAVERLEEQDAVGAAAQDKA